MRSDQSIKKLPRGRKPGKSHTQSPEPMADPNLLSLLQNQGVSLQKINIEVLGLRGCEAKQLRAVGILNLEQLASSNEAVLRIVPHFGIMKVKRLKSRLNSYLAAMLKGDNPELNIQPLIQTARLLNPQTTHENVIHIPSTSDFISELEAASESLNKLRKRLHLYVDEMKKSESK
jgi:hypothetical protein